jgi:hypothetical protein
MTAANKLGRAGFRGRRRGVSETKEVAPGVVSKMDEAEEGQKIRQAIAICVSWYWVIGFGRTTKSLGLNVGLQAVEPWFFKTTWVRG